MRKVVMVEKTNIVLIGFMGCGKSKTAQELASRCNRECFSTDEMISEQEDMTISEIFEEKGESYFRKSEKNVVTRVSEENNVIIDCGGGVAGSPENMLNLKKNGIIFYLKASAECLYENIKLSKDRPLMQVEDPLAEIKKLMLLREEYYIKADHIIDADFKIIPEMADQIEGIEKL